MRYDRNVRPNDKDYFGMSAHIPLKQKSFECSCPPNDECSLEYKLNDAAIDFLHLRGVLSLKDYKAHKEDALLELQGQRFDHLPRKFRRSSDIQEERPCCCSPAKHMLPTFITDKKFEQLSHMFQEKKRRSMLNSYAADNLQNKKIESRYSL